MSENYEVVNFCELDKYAVKSYCAVHNIDPSKNLGDITLVDEHSLPPFNMICGGSPCFVEGTLVYTDNGYIPIEQIKDGNFVLTHTNQFQRVIKTMTNRTANIVGFKPSTSEFIWCTPEHPIYVRKKSRKWDSGKATNMRVFSDPQWIAAKDIAINDYIGTAINQIEELPKWSGYTHKVNQYNNTITKNELSELFHDNSFWNIVGRYIGDGWLKTYDRNTVVICCNDCELAQLTNALDSIGFHYSVVKERAINKVQIVKKELYLFLEQFGQGASGKHLTKDILNLPCDKLRSFVEGYLAADGAFTQGRYKITSVSRRLIYEIGECVAKAYKCPFSIYFTLRPKTALIEGRVINQKDTYQICWKDNVSSQDHAFYESGYIWSPITKITTDQCDELVYNLEVENDNSYMVQNTIVHNCQDFSVAGSQTGSKWRCQDCGQEYNPLTVHYTERHKCPNCGSENLDKSRSSLLVEWLRIIRANKPIWGIYENVKNIVGKKFKDTFQMFLDELHEYGYNTYYKVLNAKDFGIPQSRERVYLIIIRREYDNGLFQFPDGFESDLCLKDVLENEVDEKYYIDTDKAKELIVDLVESGKLERTNASTVRTGGEQV